MSNRKPSAVIYGEAPFIEDMGVLTTLCLLHDEVLLFGSKSLEEHLNDYWDRSDARRNGASSAVVEQLFQVLLPEGVISFLEPADVETRFPGGYHIELPGIEGFDTVVIDGKPSVVMKADAKKLNHVSQLILSGLADGQRTVSSLLRDVNIISTAVGTGLPIVCEHAHIAPNPSTTRVSEVANFLSHRTFQKLALPELRAYHAEDILEARLKLRDSREEFRVGILELVWLLHQRNDLSDDLSKLGHDCDVLIETKITAAISMLEQAIQKHESKAIRRILRAAGGALVELGKSLIAPSIPGVLVGGSGALMKLSESMEAQQPSIQIASFVYKARKREF
ncbi:MAG: hypothetical protein BVN35_08015 [Proteobacteria bacterium ST_bin11]|nr:MAG: hypothetical protein BVN35_08015 [Proteobacteria bacterium ST_bin11]